MLCLFGNEDYIYISETHPVPALRGEAHEGSAWLFRRSLFLFLSSFGFLNGMGLSLLFTKRQERHTSQARKSYWLEGQRLEASSLSLYLYNQQGISSQGQPRQMFLERKLHILFIFTENLFSWVLLVHS